jgi:hypothetical protein
VLDILQRRMIFYLFVGATTIFLGLEAYLIWSTIERGLTVGKGVGGVVSSGGLYGCFVFFKKLLEANFLGKEILPMSRLHRLSLEKNEILRRSGQNIYDTRKSLVTTTLKFAEETLRGWIPGSHLELCVFVDVENPLLFGYFDSNGNTMARSMTERSRNPTFYIERGYEVTKLLSSPTSQPRVFSDTHDESMEYTFNTPQQRNQIRSTILLCIDLEIPCALVISSNEKNALPQSDEKLISFIRYVGDTVFYHLFAGGFIHSIRAIKPELFSPAGSLAIQDQPTDRKAVGNLTRDSE